MSLVPLSIARYIRATLMSELAITYLKIDENGYLLEWGGHTKHYGINDLQPGKSAVDMIPFLEGLLPVQHTEVLEFVCLSEGHVAHMHLVPSVDNSVWVLLFDASVEHDHRQEMQQRANELSLLNYSQARVIEKLESTRQELLAEREQLEKASKENNHLITSLSHELRSPLTSIVSYTQLMEEVQVAANKYESKYLDNVKASASHMLSTIDSILEQARLDTRQIQLNLTICDTKLLANTLQAMFAPLAAKKHLSLQTCLTPHLPERIHVDETRLRQILINLLTNAIKFTQQGFIRLTLDWQSPDQLLFSVADSGPGLNEETQKNLFKAFYKGDKMAHQPGVGLGLSISLQLAKLMYGNLSIDPSSEGSVFKGHVQARPLHFIVEPRMEERGVNDAPLTPSILVAEDSAVIKRLMDFYLKDAGYQVLTAENGAEAIDIAMQAQPDLILMDMQMPITNGYDAVQILRSQQFTAPIVGLSASALVQDSKAAMDAGCDRYLTKPVDIDTLMTIVREMLKGTK